MNGATSETTLLNRIDVDDENEDDYITKTIDNCTDRTRIYLSCLCLAMGNAIDAIEILCIGYVITEIGDVSNFQKGL